MIPTKTWALGAAAAAFALTLSACGTAATPAGTDGGAGGTIRIGIKYDQPGLGLQEGSSFTGFDVEVAKYVAKDLGYKIKLIASATRSDEGVLVRVHPTLVAQKHPLAQAGGALNALYIEGVRIGTIFVQGPGAGSSPTAAAVAADIADVMTRATRPVFQAAAASLKPFTPVDPAKSISRAYLRFLVKDEPGVIAAVSETLAEAGVSIESFLQKPVENAEGVPIVLTTHAVAESVLTTAIDRIADLPSVLERPRLLRIARI